MNMISGIENMDALAVAAIKNGDRERYRELIERHEQKVYAVAWCRLGNADLAEEATQEAFIKGYHRLALLGQGNKFAAWITAIARNTAINLGLSRRNELKKRERWAVEQAEVFPVIDTEARVSAETLRETLAKLPTHHRECLVLFYLEGKSVAEGAALLGISESTFKTRLHRARGVLREQLETRLEDSLARIRPRHLLAPAIMGSLATGSAKAAATTGFFGTVAAALVRTGLKFWEMQTVAKVSVVAAVAALSVSVPMILHSQQKATDNAAVPVKYAAAKIGASPAETASATKPVGSSGKSVVASSNGPKLILHFVDARNGKPVKGVKVEHWGGKTTAVSDANGTCAVTYSPTAKSLKLLANREPYADVEIDFDNKVTDKIPADLSVPLDAATWIGGRVVDADGQPVAGAKVGWNHRDEPESDKPPLSHQFGWIEVVTDADGKWQINRIASDMFHRIYGGAEHPDYVESDEPDIMNSEIERQLRDGTFVFHLGKGFVITGKVEDAAGHPVGGAQVLVGEVSNSSSRESKSERDGTFRVVGCSPGPTWLTANADRFSVTTKGIDVSSNSPTYQLVLQPGKIWRVKTVSPAGEPLGKAFIWLNISSQGGPGGGKTRPQIDFNARTGADGCYAWSNAPEGELKFDISAAGYVRTNSVVIPADGEEHVIMLQPATTVTGTAQDEATGQPLQHFRMILGFAFGQQNEAGEYQPSWSHFDRDHHYFSGGRYSHTLDDLGGNWPGNFLRFEADGYEPFASPLILPGQGQMTMNVTLRRGEAKRVTVLSPQGRSVPGADIGFVQPDAHLKLLSGRLDYHSGSSAMMRTDDKGQFTLPPDPTVSSIVVTAPEGFAEVPLTALKDSPKISLAAWGKIEVTCMADEKPAAGREYLFQLDGSSEKTFSCDFSAFRFVSDADGHFTVPFAPPGKHSFIRLLPQPEQGGGQSWLHDRETKVEVRSGEDMTVTLGDSGYTVKATVRWPDGFIAANLSLDAGLRTPSAIPLPTAKERSDPEFLKKYLADPRVQAERKTSRFFNGESDSQGNILVAEVPSGEYDLFVYAFDKNTQDAHGIPKFETGAIRVIVPASPAKGQLNIGELELHPPTE